MNKKTPAQNVIDAFGSITKAARAIGCDKSTIACWVSRGNGLVPAQWQVKILNAAKNEKIELKPADLVATE